MSDAHVPEPEVPAEPTQTPPGDQASDRADGDPTFDLDQDGKVSLVEEERARLGLVDARLEEIAEHGGIKGKIANVAHKLVDKLDND